MNCKKEYHEPKDGFYQQSWVVNHPGPEVNFTRIVEYKHMPNQPQNIAENPGTVIFKEYSTNTGDPYYPVPNERNRKLYKKYQNLANEEKNVIFVGRLASYKYFNMDEVCNLFTSKPMKVSNICVFILEQRQYGVQMYFNFEIAACFPSPRRRVE